MFQTLIISCCNTLVTLFILEPIKVSESKPRQYPMEKMILKQRFYETHFTPTFTPDSSRENKSDPMRRIYGLGAILLN